MPGLAPVLPFGKIVAGRGLLSVITAMKNFETRFWEKVDKSGGPNSCWNWTGGKREDGRGQSRLNGKSVSAPRVSYYLKHGKFPENGKWVLHKCDNPSCVNPDHFFVGGVAENARDMVEKGRHFSQVNRSLFIKKITLGCAARKNSTGFKGVYKAGSKFSSQISINCKTKYLGVFDSPEKAYEAYLKELAKK